MEIIFTFKIIIPVILALIGLIGNSIGFAIFFRKKFSKFQSRNIYRTLAITDSLTLICFLLHATISIYGLENDANSLC